MILAPILVIATAASGFLLVRSRGGHGPAVASADTTGASGGKEGQGDREENSPVPVETALVTPRDLPAYFNATGSLAARRRVDIVSKAGGQVIRLAVEEGQRVAAGQVLLELDHREEGLLFDEAGVKAETARRELDRIQGLRERGLGSEQDLERTKQESEVAAYQRDLAQVHLDDKIVKAPFAGLVAERMVELGQTVNVGQPLVSVADVSPLEVKLYLPEQVAHGLRDGQPVEIRPDVNPGTVLAGKVALIAPTVDPSTSTMKVTLRVVGAEAAARVGSFVRARITTDVHRAAPSVPKKALVPEAGATYLYVAESDTVRKVPVTTGYTDDDYAEILSGVAPGERIVTVGQGGLRTGSRIRDLTGAEPGAGAVEGGREADTADAGKR